MFRRTAVCYAVIVFDGLAVFQTEFFIAQAIYIMCMQLNNSMVGRTRNIFAESKMQLINFVNEFFLYLLVILNPMFLVELKTDEATINWRNQMGLVVIFVLITNMLFNLLTVLYAMMFSLFQLGKETVSFVIYMKYGRMDIWRKRQILD